MNDLTEKLLQSKKYGGVCPDTVRRVISDCTAKYKKEKDIEKAVREHLHGVTSAFMTESECRRARAAAEAADFETLLACHASTRERMPVASADALYDRIFSVTGVPESLLDLACGLNPAYLKWRYPQIHVVGTDISGDCVRILQTLGIDARLADLLCGIPSERFDLALLFKILPLLERQKKGAADEILRSVNAAYIVVSFPTKTLSGRDVGMAAHYGAWMAEHLPESRSVTDSFELENELYFVLEEK